MTAGRNLSVAAAFLNDSQSSGLRLDTFPPKHVPHYLPAWVGIVEGREGSKVEVRFLHCHYLSLKLSNEEDHETLPRRKVKMTRDAPHTHKSRSTHFFTVFFRRQEAFLI